MRIGHLFAMFALMLSLMLALMPTDLFAAPMDDPPRDLTTICIKREGLPAPVVEVRFEKTESVPDTDACIDLAIQALVKLKGIRRAQHEDAHGVSPFDPQPQCPPSGCRLAPVPSTRDGHYARKDWDAKGQPSTRDGHCAPKARASTKTDFR